MVLENKHLNKNIFQTFGLDSNEARTFLRDDTSTSSFDASEVVELDEGASSPICSGRTGAFRRHHTVDVQYPSLNLLTDPAEEFILNKPQNSEQRYAPHPLILDDEIMRVAARDKVADNGFYSVYPCDQLVPDLSIRTLTGQDLFVDVEEATQCHGFTHIGTVVFRITSQPWLGPQVRIRRSTRFRWGDDFDYNERDYNFSLKDFMENRVKPVWYLDLVHLMGIESDRAARFIALKLKHYTQTDVPRQDLANVYVKFVQSFGAKDRRDEEFELFLPHFVDPYKTPVYKRTPDCMYCHQKCSSGASLPCSAGHVMHHDCLLEVCRNVDTALVGCSICKAPIFENPDTVDKLKFNVHDRIFYNDPRFSKWENFEKSCADLDSTQSSTNEFRVTVTRDFMTGIFHKMVASSIEPGIPEVLRFDIPDEYALLETLVDGQFMRLEGTRIPIWALDRWIKRRVFFRFRSEFLKWDLDRALTEGEKKVMHQHDFMRKILRRGWYDAYLRNLNRTLQFLSLRACLCPEGHGKIYHWHGHREFYNPRVVERNQAEITPTRKHIYQWQESELGRRMRAKFHEEVRKGKEEMGRPKGMGKLRIPLWSSDE